MDVRHQQKRGGPVVAGVAKQPKPAVAQANNRRALGDIGNLVDIRQQRRPVTRSFGAQLLSNAQAAAEAAGALKKQVNLNADEKGKQREPAKPKPDVEVIEISPDSGESSKKNHSAKKKLHALSSVLTARSKVACGITDRPPTEKVHDIDAKDAGDQLSVVEFVEDIYKFYKSSENSKRPHDYMGSQVEINSKMRAILADWLIEVHHKFELMPETLYLTFNIIDRYLSLKKVPRKELQLVGVSAMLIACKYEEIWAPEVNDFICISDRAYSREQLLAKEKCILNELHWDLTVPTPYVFLVRFLKAALSDKEMENMVYFFAELGLMQYPMIMYCPSMIAASAVYAARYTLKKTPTWNETLRRHSGFTETQLMDCVKLLVTSHSAAEESKLKVVFRKYSSPQRGAVALHPPATRLLETKKTQASS